MVILGCETLGRIVPAAVDCIIAVAAYARPGAAGSESAGMLSSQWRPSLHDDGRRDDRHGSRRFYAAVVYSTTLPLETGTSSSACGDGDLIIQADFSTLRRISNRCPAFHFAS